MKIFFETTPDMLAILDEDGRVLDCNSHYVKNSRYEKDELIGMIGPIDLVSEKDRQKAMSAFSEVIEKGVKHDVPLEVVRKDGTKLPSIWSGAAFFDEKGKLQGYLVTGKDLSKIKELESEIEKTREDLQNEKMFLLGQITSRIAHDIKNPLNVIKIGLDLLSERPNLKVSDDYVKQKIQTLEKNVERISTQVDFVLDYIREKPLKREKIVLSDCISESLKNIDIPENVKVSWDKSEKMVYGDLFQLEIVCTNLLINSIQSFEGKSGEISFRFSEDEKYIIIEMRDSGPGIPEPILPYVFEPLVTTKQTGTGLGLVSCKRIIENHGGVIYIKNNPTTVTIKIPKEGVNS